jgi:hypothetical protein
MNAQELAGLLKRLTTAAIAAPVTPRYPGQIAKGNGPGNAPLIGETPPKGGGCYPVTPVTPEKQGGEEKIEPRHEPEPVTPSGQGAYWCSVSAPWRAANRGWQAHYWSCRTCQAAQQTQGGPPSGERCRQGAALYEAAQGPVTP